MQKPGEKCFKKGLRDLGTESLKFGRHVCVCVNV
jgi:hypothetical protein